MLITKRTKPFPLEVFDTPAHSKCHQPIGQSFPSQKIILLNSSRPQIQY